MRVIWLPSMYLNNHAFIRGGEGRVINRKDKYSWASEKMPITPYTYTVCLMSQETSVFPLLGAKLSREPFGTL